MKTWWGLRHVRYWLYRRQARRWARMWADWGVELGYPNLYDEVVLRNIWEGKV